MIYATSDIHGYSLDRFRSLLDKAHFTQDDDLYVLGDVIDRNGDGGVAMLRWMMAQPNIEFLRGNHEDMLLASRLVFENVTDDSIDKLNSDTLMSLLNWMNNGAAPTMDSLKKLVLSDRSAFDDLIDYIEDAPYYATVMGGEQAFVLCHAGLGNYRKGRPLSDYSAHDLTWNRPRLFDSYFTTTLTVFGHTPTGYLDPECTGRAYKTKTWIDIDTGAAGGGSPMLLRLDDLKEFYAD